MEDDERQSHALTNEALSRFYGERGFAGRVGFGRRPAVLIIDLAKGWTDEASPLGSNLDTVIGQTRIILDIARSRDVPLFFTTMAFQPGLPDCGSVVLKKKPNQEVLIKGSDMVELDPRLGFQPTEILIEKQRASAFFGTTLLSQLNAHSIDTLIITGCSTSGCVRASAQAAHDNNLHVIIPRAAVGDRSPIAHESNLFDMDARMGDVVSVEEVTRYLSKIPKSASV